MRVLLSEGASTSAREAITALGLRGHHVEVCDPNPHCLGRFSRFVRRFHRCPPLATDPAGYLAFVLDRLDGGRFDVLLPIHEQGFLFAKAQAAVARHAAVALPSFETYRRAHNKLGFSEILSELGLPQPATSTVIGLAALQGARRLPVVLKVPVGTASRGAFVVRTDAQWTHAVAELAALDAFASPLIVQNLIDGEFQQAQAVFARGRLIAFHAYRQVARGAGGGSAIKQSLAPGRVRGDLERIGAHLAWHGALSLDYIVDTAGVPHYFDCNPRLVEPMSAVLAGVDLVDVLLKVSLGEAPPPLPAAPAGVVTHLAMQALLGHALRGANRVGVLGECWRLFAKRGPYAVSREELTPVATDWMSAVPTTVAALWLLVTPQAAHYLPRRGWGAQLLTPHTIRMIEAMDPKTMDAKTMDATTT